MRPSGLAYLSTAPTCTPPPSLSGSTSTSNGCSRCSGNKRVSCARCTSLRSLKIRNFLRIRPLVDWLDYNGFSLITKPAKAFTDEDGRRKVKGNMDVEIAIEMMRLGKQLDHIVLFSGDGDFRYLIAAMQDKGKRVTVISSLVTHPPMIADELRRQADQFVEFADLQPIICRQLAPLHEAPTIVPKAR